MVLFSGLGRLKSKANRYEMYNIWEIVMSEIPTYHFRYPDEKKFPFEIIRIQDTAILSKMASRPRRDTFYAMFWITAGSGVYNIDFERYKICPNSLFFVQPGQVHNWVLSDPIQGYAIPFKEDLFHVLGGHRFTDALDLFDDLSSPAGICLQQPTAGIFAQIFDNLFDEFCANRFGREEIIISLLQIMLIMTQRQMHGVDQVQPRTAAQQLTRQFMQLIKDTISAEDNLQTYAAKMGVTVGHLTETVKKEMGVPAGALLRQRLALEAKRMLVHTDLSAAQIAEKLGYSDPSYFGRFFKRETGETPRNFREQFHLKS